MQLPGGPQDPGETEPVLKRQGGWPPCLGRLPGMTGPRGLVSLGPGLSQSKAKGQIPAVTSTSVTPPAHTHAEPGAGRCPVSCLTLSLGACAFPTPQG